MHEINHPNILHLHDYLISDHHYYLVMDYCNQGDMQNYMKSRNITRFPEAEALYFLRQIINGFYRLRLKKILHRDFKLTNIFVHNDRLVIGDFGFAKMGVDTAKTMLGSPLTMAPELIFNLGNQTAYNSKADLWSIGIVFYELLFGKPPFEAFSIEQLKQKITKNAGQNLGFPLKVSAELKDLLVRLLTIDPQQRIEWKEVFSHPLFRRKDAR